MQFVWEVNMSEKKKTQFDFVNDPTNVTVFGAKSSGSFYQLEYREPLAGDQLSTLAMHQLKLLDVKALKNQKPTCSFVTIHTDDGIKTLEVTRIPVLEDGEVISLDTICEEFSVAENSVMNRDKVLVAMKQIAHRFTELDSLNFDEVLNYCLAKIGKAISADRAYIFTYNFTHNFMENTHEWCEEGIEPEIDNLKEIPITDFLDGWVNEHRAKKVVLIDNVQKLDQESNLYQVLDPQGIKSLYTLPLIINDECFGFIGFDAVREYRTWTNVPQIVEIIPVLISGTFRRKEDIFSIREAQLEIEVAKKSIEEFMAKLNHELKTPMVGLSSALEMLRETELTTEQSEYLETIDYSIDSLGNLVGNISSQFRDGTEAVTVYNDTFNLEEEMVKLISMNRQLANSKKLGLYLTYDYELPTVVNSDKSKLRQVLNNLIQNGIRYTNYGHVELKVSRVDYYNPYVDVTFEVSDTGIGISKDNVDQIFTSFYREKHTKIGKPTGSGLGLNIANNLVNLLGGKIKVDTEKFVGSSFEFTLRLYVPEQSIKEKIDKKVLLLDITMNYHSNVKQQLESLYKEVSVCNYDNGDCSISESFDMIFIHTNDEGYYESIAQEVLEKIANNNKQAKKILLYDNTKKAKYIESFPLYDSVKEVPCTSNLLNQIEAKATVNQPRKVNKDNLSVLLVEDNNINRKIMVKLLESMGLDITEAVDGFEALEKASKQSFDLIFMDILMPIMNGYETTKKIRELENENSSVPIFAVSANDLEKTKKEGMEFGMNGALEKPLTSMAVKELLRKLFTIDDSVTSLDKYDVFDIKNFEEMYDDSFKRDIIDTFKEEFQVDKERVKNAFSEKDMDELYKSIHYMKGTFTYLAAKRLKNITEVILQLINEQSFEKALGYEKMYFDELEALSKEVDNYIK